LYASLRPSRACSTFSLRAWACAALIGLSEDEAEFHRAAEAFADNEMRDAAAQWDEDKVLPVDVLRSAAQLGFGGLFVREDVGGTAVSRFQGTIIFEALATACPSTTAYITIHNMCAWMIDTFGSEYVTGGAVWRALWSRAGSAGARRGWCVGRDVVAVGGRKGFGCCCVAQGVATGVFA
jgi:alkylation response protein AidB-like acyl-CoA dehydrogenase